LVTGGAGFIGSHLCDILVEQGHDVVVLDNLSSGKLENLKNVLEKVTFVQGDITEALPKTDGAFDAVIHLAALISGYDSLNDPYAYTQENIDGLLRVIDLVIERKIPRVVFASSSTVYGNNEAAALNELQLPAPMSVYANTKLFGEHLLRMYGAMHGFNHCSLRFFNVYGPRQAVDHAYANVTCKFSHAAAKGLPISLYGDGEQSRDFVYVDDVVSAILLALNKTESDVYNVGTGCQESINGLIFLLEDISGSSLQIYRHDEWPNDIRRIAADISRAKRELGYSPRFSIREGLERTVSYHEPF
jgi:UDP-glucose 4-epimerase